MNRTSRLAVLLAAALAVSAVALDRPSRPGGREAHDAEAYPSDWFGAQRAFPFDTLPQGRFVAALEQTLLEKALAGNALEAGAAWQLAGPSNIGGRVTALVATNGGRTVYLGAANGGVFKSTNAGVNWTPVFDALGVLSIGALAMDPADTNVIYAGTGEANGAVQSYDGNGLYRTTNGGQSWRSLGLAATRRIAQVAVDPSNPNRIYVAAMGAQYSTGPDRGLYRSEDGGESWTKTFFLNDSTGVCDVVVNPAHPETVFIATWERIRHYTYRRAFGPGCGIWRSADFGTTWTRLQNGLPTPSDSVGRIALAIAPSRPSTIYAQIVSGANLGYGGLGVYRSVDAGQTWTRRDSPGGTFSGAFGGFGWYFGKMAVDPLTPEKIFCLGVSFLASGDGGANFTPLTGAAHVDFHAIWVDPTNPTRVFTGSDGGFFWSGTGGGAWTKSVDLPITQFYAGTVHPTDPARLYGGTQDNGCMKTAGTVGGWSFLNISGDGFYVVVDPVNPNTLWAESQFCTGGAGPLRSIDGGGSFSAPSGLVGSDRFNWSAPIVLNPKNHNVVLTASHRVYRSTNNGVGYSIISPDLTTNPPTQTVFGTISTLDVSPVDTSLYYAGTDDGRVWRSQNRGGSWENISAGLPVRSITRVTADPANANVVYVTLSGFGQDELLAHVYRSPDRGSSWSSIASNLPDIPANDLVVDPANPQALYLATDLGVWATHNLGAGWFPLGFGLPNQSVYDLTLHAASRTLVAATYGRSQWKLDLTGLPVAVGDAPGAAGTRLALAPPAPNPARGAVRLTLELPRASEAEITIYDPAGRRVREIQHGPLAAGEYAFMWDGTDRSGRLASPGVYFVRASSGASVATRRVVVAR